jgi:predicted O-methyltransferase YrrM
MRIHSPFVFSFYNEVLLKSNPECTQKTNKLIQLYHTQNLEIPVEDYGAGSKTGNDVTNTRMLLKNVSSTPKYGQLLCNLVTFLNCRNILELGTNLGIGTAYLAAPGHHNKIISIEGNKALTALARQSLADTGFEKIEIIAGTFENTLPEVLASHPPFDLVFVDGNHRKEPTLRYFEWLLEHVHDHSAIIFDDIYWSEEMTEAWHHICRHKSVRLSIDLYKFGIVFFRKEHYNKEHFILWY